MSKKMILDILEYYDLPSELKSYKGHGDGHINDTFLLEFETEAKGEKYILQRINTDIFKDYKGLMSNIEKVTDYIKERSDRPEDCISLVYTKDGKSYVDCDWGVYRIYNFIGNTVAYSFADDPSLLYEAGYAFGDFQKKLNDFDASLLVESIPRFHDTPNRFELLKEAIKADDAGRLSSVKEQVDFALAREEKAGQIVAAMKSGEVPLRVTHNDTKINNVLMDKDTNKAKCVVDLDTVMPGSVLYDYGDAIRSCGSTLIEDAKNIEDLEVDFTSFESYTTGFLTALDGVLNETEMDMLVLGALTMTLECGTRFLTDYLNGDTYFKVDYPEHNLVRAKNQFKYVLELEKNYEKLVTIIKNI